MISDFHFLRPLWLIAIVPLLGLGILLWRQKPKLQAWDAICDPHLLAHLMQKSGQNKRMGALSCVLLSLLCLILSIAGPAWLKLPVATYKPIQPRVLVLDMSEQMLVDDLSPNRLARAKFKLHDLFSRKGVGQFGLVVFTGEPFVVSPLTDDAHTISSLLSALTPDVLPVKGQNLDTALQEANQLIKNAGFTQGQILVLTADTPSLESILLVKSLANQGVSTSIMPMTANPNLNPLFARFADSGDGQLLTYSSDANNLESWLAHNNKQRLALNQQDEIPLWRDEGRWLLIPALFLLLPIFQRGWLYKVAL